MSKNPRGFTLLEISVVLGAGALLLALAIPSYSSIRSNVAVGGYADQVASTLQTAQSRAMTSQGGLPWGVHLNAASYVLYSGSWSSPTDQTTYSVGNGITITANASPANCEVVFSHLTGGGTNTCTSPLKVGVGSTQKTITVGTTTGQVSVQ